jgi:hypothetical protein
MAEPTKQTVKRLFALSGNLCAFPGCSLPMVESSGTVTGEICHIQARSKGGPRYNASLPIKERNVFENLILLCGHHHKIIDAQPEIYTTETLIELKGVHESAAGRPEKIEDNFYAQLLLNAYKNIQIKNNSGNISINSPGSIQGKNVTVNTERKKVKIEAPPGSLGADSVLSKYIAHLISRYNEYASKEPNRKTKFNYGAVSRNVEAKFGARWQLLGGECAQEVISYLHGRINKTRLARINKGKGYPAYSALQEYIQKYGAKGI